MHRPWPLEILQIFPFAMTEPQEVAQGNAKRQALRTMMSPGYCKEDSVRAQPSLVQARRLGYVSSGNVTPCDALISSLLFRSLRLPLLRSLSRHLAELIGGNCGK